MPTKKLKTEVSQQIAVWKQIKIVECRMDFCCGGDSMNDYDFKLYDKKGNEVLWSEHSTKEGNVDTLKEFFEDEVFRRVEFYECSDGHYIGEFGQVVITLNDDEDDFEYEKQAKSEWSERYSERIPIGITPKEAKFLIEKVANMNGGEGDKNINYKIDCIITDEEDKMVDNILNRIDETCSEYEFSESQGEPEDFYSWSTDEDGGNIEIKGDNLYVDVSRNFIETREESNW